MTIYVRSFMGIEGNLRQGVGGGGASGCNGLGLGKFGRGGVWHWEGEVGDR